MVTLDTINLGWRPHDLETSYLLFAHGTSCAFELTDPVFMATIGMESWAFVIDMSNSCTRRQFQRGRYWEGKVAGACWLGKVNSAKIRTWEDLKEPRELWDGLSLSRDPVYIAVS